MRTRWLGAALVAWCLMGSVAHAQWGLNGQEVDPRLMAESDDPPEGRPGIQINAEYLLWWFKDPHLSANIATSGTAVLVGPDTLNYPDPFSGGRVTARVWGDTTSTGSLEVSGLFAGQRSNTVQTGPGTIPFVGVPGPAGVGVFDAMTVVSKSRLWGGEGNLVASAYDWLEFSLGFRYLDLGEDLDVIAQRTGPPKIFSDDHFGTRNQFFGGQVGVRGSYSYGSLSVSGQAKIAVGDNIERVRTGELFVVNGTTIPAAGTFVGATNLGEFKKSKLSIVPETELRIGYKLAGNIELYAGYNWLYFTQVVRPGDQIDIRTTTTGVKTLPQVPLAQTAFWAEGFDFGLEIRY